MTLVNIFKSKMAAKFMICNDFVGKRLVIAHKFLDGSNIGQKRENWYTEWYADFKTINMQPKFCPGGP